MTKKLYRLETVSCGPATPGKLLIPGMSYLLDIAVGSRRSAWVLPLLLPADRKLLPP